METSRWIKPKWTDGRLYLVIGLIVTVPIVLMTVYFWDWLSGNDSGSTTVRNVGLVLGGFYALLVAIWRSLVAQHQSEAAESQANVARQSLLNERYQYGARMLGDDLLSVRLGGIYALQGLADEVPETYHVPIMRLFCAFARTPQLDEEVKNEMSLREDVQAIIEAIADAFIRRHRARTRYRHPC